MVPPTLDLNPLCKSRLSCDRCRASIDFRQVAGLPEVCPLGVGEADTVKDWQGRVIPYSTESTPAQCLECPKFALPAHCGKCGCASERLRPVAEILICPIKKFLRPPGWTKNHP